MITYNYQVYKSLEAMTGPGSDELYNIVKPPYPSMSISPMLLTVIPNMES